MANAKVSFERILRAFELMEKRRNIDDPNLS